MTLDSGERLLGEMHSATDTYRQILTICTLTRFQLVAVKVGNDGLSV